MIRLSTLVGFALALLASGCGVGSTLPAAPDTTPPTVSVTSPTAGSTVSGTITVSANTSDNVGVLGVQFFLDGANLGAEDTSASYSVMWATTTAANGSHTLSARARDAAGNQATSSSVNVTVNNVSPPPASSYSLSFSTYFGGTAFERAQGFAVDKNGFIYFVGNTQSADLPTTAGAYDTTYNGDNTASNSGDGYVAKLTQDGSTLVWATYLGGTGGDRIYNVQVDDAGFVYVAVWTNSADFPTTPGAYDTIHNSPGAMDLAFTKMRPDGSGLVYSTFVGGSGVEGSRNSLYIDAAGNLYSSGFTNSPNFPTTAGAYQRALMGGGDAYLLKLSADGSQLLFSTLFGGSGDDSGVSQVKVHSDGSIYFAGYTNSRDLPVTANAYQRNYGGDAGAPWGNGDGFVVRFSANGSSRIYCTYLGGSGDDYVAVNNGLAIDAAGNAIVIGVTNSLNFPVSSNAFQKTLRGGEDGFVSILSADGTALLRSTYIGGSANEETSGVAVDPLGNVYFSGNTQSSDYPVTANAFQQNHRGGAGNTDGWLTKLSPDLSTLLYSTYLGGSGTTGAFGDRGRALALDSGGNIILSGDTNSSDFPVTPGVYQPAYRGGADAFLAKFAPS